MTTLMTDRAPTAQIERPPATDGSLPGDGSKPAQRSPEPNYARQPATGRMVGAILALYFVISTLYNLAVPVGEAPDEPSHVDFVQTLLRTGQLPTIPVGSVRFSYEAEQPPLYYILQAGWMGAIWPNSNLLPDLQANPDFSFAKETPYNVYLHNYPAREAVPVHLMRLLSTLLGLCTLMLVWLMAREMWPSEAWSAIVALGFAALLPGFTFASGTVTNDTLAALAGAAVLYVLLRAMRRGLTARLALLAGVALGVGLLSKRSLLVFLPLVLLAFVLSPCKDGRTRLACIGAGVIASVVVGVWPFVSNMVQYGDPLATAVTEAAKGGLASPLANVPFFWLDRGYIGGLLDSLWGVFGLRNLELPGWMYFIYYVIVLVGLIMSVYYLRRVGGAERRALLVLVAAILLVYAGVAYQNTQFWAVQGRLLLPGFAALSLFVGRGVSTLFLSALKNPRVQQVAVIALMILLTALNLYALLGRLIPAYYG